MHQFHLKFYRRVEHNLIHIKFDSGGHAKFGLRYGPFLLRFWLKCGFGSIMFEEGQQFHSHFYKRVNHHKTQVKFKFGSHPQCFNELWPILVRIHEVQRAIVVTTVVRIPVSFPSHCIKVF